MFRSDVRNGAVVSQRHQNSERTWADVCFILLMVRIFRIFSFAASRVQTVGHLVCVLSKEDRRTEPLAPGPEPCFKGSNLVTDGRVESSRVFSRVTVNRLRGKNQWGLFAVTKLTLYVADIQTTQTATHSMDPTHSHQGHKPKIRNSINIHECWHG